MARACDAKFCTCNPGTSKERKEIKRVTRKRERRQWKKEI